MLEIRLLGEFDVRLDGEPIEIPSRPSQSLLAYLVMTAGTRHRREKLAGLLWPDSEEVNARSNLRHALWRLRKALKKGYFQSDKVSIHFEPESEYQLDVKELEDLSEISGSIEAQKRTLSVYGGELLPGFYDGWVQLERERLRAVFEGAVQHLLDNLIQQASWPEVLEWGERWIALGQVPEPAFRALMIAHSGMSDTAGMAGVYQRCVEALREELGVEPSEQTHLLFESLSKGEGPPVAKIVAEVALQTEVSSGIAVGALLDSWHKKGVEVLDLPSLAIVHSAQVENAFGRENAVLLISSTLHHGLDISPWLDRVRTQQEAVEVLAEIYDRDLPQKVRSRIVEGLELLPDRPADQELLRILETDDSPTVRERAAMAAVSKGSVDDVTRILLEDFNSGKSSLNLPALIAVSDIAGVPEDLERFPRIQIAISVAYRRWKARTDEIKANVRRGAVGGAIVMAVVANAQLIPAAFWNPEAFEAALEVMDLPVWILTNVLIGLMWGGVLGASISFGVGIADTIWKGRSRTNGRRATGAIAGVIHSIFLILLSLIGAFAPAVTAGVYSLVYLIYGLLIGGTLSYVVPEVGVFPPSRKMIPRSLVVAGAIAALAIPTVFLVYRRLIPEVFVDLLFAFLFPLGLGLSFSHWGRGPRTVNENEFDVLT